MSNNFQAYSHYYDLLYKDKDYKGESDYIIELLHSFGKARADLLEYGCGTGNHAEHFCAAGFSVTGIEKSSDMVKLALAKNIKHFLPVVGDITSYETDRKFDAVVALFHVISYLTENVDLRNCFLNTSRHLKQNGLFVFDVWYGPAVSHQKPVPRCKKMETTEIELFRFAQPVWHSERNVIDVNYDILVRNKQTSVAEGFSEKHSMRYFSIPEIEMLALQTGFSVVRVEEFLTREAAGNQTWGVCFVLKKN